VGGIPPAEPSQFRSDIFKQTPPMKKSIIIILSLCLALGILFFVLNKPRTITNYPSKGETIIAFGDSLVEGIGSTNGHSFPEILEKLMGEPIINMGISGDTSKDGLARIKKVQEKNPKVVMVLFGGNDFLRRVPSVETFKNIDDIVIALQDAGAVVVLLGVRGGILTDQYEEHFEKIAKTRGALYVEDVLDGIITHKKYMSDAIHPNDVGYKKIAEKIYPSLKKALGK